MKLHTLFGGIAAAIILLIWAIAYMAVRWVFTGEFFDE